MPTVAPGQGLTSAPWFRASRLVARPVRLGLIAYLVLILMVSRFQSLLIFPGQSSRGHPDAQVDSWGDAELIPLRTSDGDRIVAIFGQALDPAGQPLDEPESRPTILFFYGNGANLKNSLDLFTLFRKLGAHVMVPEYVGYGMSEGRAGEAGCYATAEAAYQALRERPEVNPSRIVAVGWSLGGAVAIDLATRQEVSGLIVFGTFTRMADMARLYYPWLPASWLLRHHFENLEKIAQIQVPTLIIHGELDELVPFSMAERLAEAAGGPVTRLDIPEGHHSDLFLVGSAEILASMEAFLEAIPKTAVP